MCGIIGAVYDSTLFFDRIRVQAQAIASIKHRGPDAEGAYVQRPYFLGHTRLAIRDLSSAANQPFTDPTGNHILIFNGELFNYATLRTSLQNMGCTFRSNSDTEVLLNLLIHQGIDCLHQINGFFAFAYLHKPTNTLILARDRFGVKPLVYYNAPGTFVFASEIQALKTFEPEQELDKTALQLYLKLSYVPAPYTMYKGIRKLEPGHILTYSKGQIEVKKWYQLPVANPTQSEGENEHITNLQSLLESSVALRLEADVEVGTFLSGGLDSGLITAIAKRIKPNLKTFSVGYKNVPYIDESAVASKHAAFLQTKHHEMLFSMTDLVEAYHTLSENAPEPFGDSSALNVFLLSREVSKHVKVALSGDGADEVFGGYNKHRAEAFLHLYSTVLNTLPTLRLPFSKHRYSAVSDAMRKFEKLIQSAKLIPSERYWDWCGPIADADINKLLQPSYHLHKPYLDSKTQYLLPFYPKRLRTILDCDINLVLPNDMLYKIDCMSMRHGLEVREPFLDYRIVSLAQQLPQHLLFDFQSGKKILRNVASLYMPKSFFKHKKKGFEVPLASLLQTGLDQEVTKYLRNQEFVLAQGIFNPEYINKLLKKDSEIPSGNAPNIIWNILQFQKWFCHNF